ncbi:hypothetical protein [Anaerostipes hadrus]|uniref:hypothetical protein n=2 Tax=Bacillota TaxID=1239 RepID=UPI001EDE3792|nr:hypothetical protein [Anaerostipes hadrus]MCG4627564.1 hypothetical protein [Anaerostipes hadrus]
MQRIFMFIFSIGFILYILCAIIAKIEGDFCIMKGRKLESREDIGERLKYKVIISQVEESIKLTQYLFCVVEAIGGNGFILMEAYKNAMIQPSIDDQMISILVSLTCFVLFNFPFIAWQFYLLKDN